MTSEKISSPMKKRSQQNVDPNTDSKRAKSTEETEFSSLHDVESQSEEAGTHSDSSLQSDTDTGSQQDSPQNSDGDGDKPSRSSRSDVEGKDSEEDEEDEAGYSFGDGSGEEGYSGSSEEDEDESEDEGEDGGKAGDKFVDGFSAYRSAFLKTMDMKVSDDALGPVLAANKTLIAKRLDEANSTQAKSEAKKEKHLLREKGHVIPENVLDTKEKSLVRLATKGVVKLFNAVSKAQSVQSGFDVSKSKNAKIARKESKAAFLKELNRMDQPKVLNPGLIDSRKEANANQTGCGWAALQDNFMLTSSRFKDWDKMPEATKGVDGFDEIAQHFDNSESSSSD
eukprot:TRINITY_DN33456_c0_g1_i1.p1 TRINITY_DN33456_c0_g1~~TRINITY_DN33456_c0_g1_i1.p1  ORF type:complete len:339 (-),score=101.93 TRINITY_DN33456_c0_g1_i1:398-1414(-)